MVHVVAILAGSVMIWSGAEKLATPDVLARAMAELLSNRGVSANFVRTFGVIEIAVGTLVNSRWIHAGAGALAMVGLLFAVFGVVGRIRVVEMPCGCFGSSMDRPLGIQSIGSGALLVLSAVFLLAWAHTTTPSPAVQIPMAGGTALAAAVAFRWALVRPALDSARSRIWRPT